jgi:hypothetical protein
MSEPLLGSYTPVGGWKQIAGRPLALWDCPDHTPEYANPHQPNRFFSCREAQGTPTELAEVGDLSCRTIKPDSAGISLFWHRGGGQ